MANFPRKAFILGAGLGTRLKPLTDKTPKPLLPIAGEPMVMRALRHLIRAGVSEFIINTHHCAEAWAIAFPTNEFETAKITFVHEPILLETGGGLANVAPLLNESDMDLVIWNGDILSECDLLALFNTHVKTGAESTLLVRKEGPNPNVRVDNKGIVTDLRNRLNAKGGEYQYTGICSFKCFYSVFGDSIF
jgi:NDP-sugar pyrophosphorylase family protein